jgi:hypothetical protein
MALTKISRSLLDTGVSDSSDATAITIDSSENVFVGSGTSNGISGGTTGLQVSGAGFKGMISATRHDNNAYGPSLMLGKSRNTSVGSNTIVQNGDALGAVTFFADDGTNLDSRGAEISAVVSGSPSENDTPAALIFSTTADGSAAPSERMRILSDGSVGINTSSPNQMLHVHGGRVQITRSNDINEFGFIEQDASGSAMGIFTNGGAIRFGANGTSTEHMRIDSSGNVLVGTTTGGSKVVAEAVPNGTTYLAKWSGTGGTALYLEVGGSAVGSITCTASGTAYNTSSDYRLKENVNYEFDALTRVKELKPARFNFIVDADKTVDGFLAHEVSDIVPEAITGEKDAIDEEGNPDYQDIDQSKLVPLLTKAIQEQQTLIETLQAKVEALENG